MYKQKAKVISVFSQKGGVGKSTVSINVAAALVLKGYKVLCVDLDPQSSVSQVLGWDPIDEMGEPRYIASGNINACLRLIEQGKDLDDLKEWLHGKLSEAVYPTYIEGLNLMPSSREMDTHFQRITDSSFKGDEKYYILDFIFGLLKSEYDFIVVDTLPTKSLIGKMALIASDYAIGVAKPDGFVSTSFVDTITWLSEIRRDYATDVEFLGTVVNMFKKRGKVDNEATQLVQNTADRNRLKIFDTKVPYNSKISDSNFYGLAVTTGKAKSNEVGKIAFLALTDEILACIEGGK